MLPLESSREELPEWTHFSRRSRVYAGVETFSWGMDAMERLGAWLIGFRRRYGSSLDARRNLTDRDYEWAAPKGRLSLQKQDFPDRAGFGLPLPFRKKSKDSDGYEKDKGQNVTWGSPDGDTRRASPLLLHVARVGDKFVPVLTYLPARFLPEGGLLYFQGDDHKTSEPTPGQLKVIDRFLDDLASEEKKLIEKVVA
jgi:CRISPR-associated protein Cmr1